MSSRDKRKKERKGRERERESQLEKKIFVEFEITVDEEYLLE